jgi:hypothetical protein
MSGGGSAMTITIQVTIEGSESESVADVGVIHTVLSISAL